MKDHAAVQEVRCPTCGAEPGERCRTTAGEVPGREAQQFHQRRHVAYGERPVVTVTCQREDEFDDAYPEFAPEPIVVRCERSATVLWEDDSDPEGQYEHGHAMCVCTEHAFEMMQYTLAHGEDFSCRALTPEDRNLFVAGAAFAETQALSFHVAEIAYHEGFGDAGLATPEFSPQMFDVGWEWAMAKRVQLLLDDEEAAEEARQQREDARCWEEEQRNGNLHGRNVL